MICQWRAEKCIELVTVKRFESLYGGQFTLSTQLIKQNNLVILPTDAASQFLYSFITLCNYEAMISDPTKHVIRLFFTFISLTDMFIYKKPTAFGLPMLKLIKTNLSTSHSVCFPMKNNVELLLI